MNVLLLRFYYFQVSFFVLFILRLAKRNYVYVQFGGVSVQAGETIRESLQLFDVVVFRQASKRQQLEGDITEFEHRY